MQFGVNEFFLIAIAFFLLAIIYYVVSKKWQWVVLLIGSCIFYYEVNKTVTIFLLISTVVSYLISLYNGFANEKINSGNDKKQIDKFILTKKLITALAVFIELGILFIFKYYNVLAENINNYFSTQLGVISIVIPLGISFYTFQTLGYCIDVYRDSYKPQKNFFKYMLFSTFFLQIFQGPIGRYNLLSEELYKEHKVSYKRIMFGLQRIGWGFFKKLVIADRASILVNNVLLNYFNFSGYEIIVTLILYAIVIYTDFSGFMDIVLGMGQVLDIKLSENFNVPYFSKTIPEYWRRWHITLNTWFKDYLFYPLLRCSFFEKIGKFNSILSTSIALFIVWITTGAWHGAKVKYLLWGVYFVILMILSLIFTPIFTKLRKKFKIDNSKFSYKLFQILRTFSLICIGYILFFVNSLGEIKHIFLSIFNNNLWIFTDGSLFRMGLDSKDWFVLVVAIVILLIVDICKYKGINVREKIAEQGIIFRWIIYYMLIFSVIIFGIYGPEYNASNFIYMGF